MNVLVLDPQYKAISVVDKYQSLIWTDRFYECGDFEIYVSASYLEFQTYKEGYYLQNRDSDHTMLIESLELESDSETGDKLRITGRSLESILDRRIVWSRTKYSGPFQAGIKKLLDENVISPSISARKIPNFIFKESTDPRILEMNWEFEEYGKNLYEMIADVCAEKKVGFKIILTSDNKFEFSLYLGQDRSYSQFKNPYVIFSPEFDNVISSNYIHSIANYKNTVLVSVKEDKVDKTVVVNKNDISTSGLDRREVFKSGSNKNTDGAMRQDGLEELEANPITEMFEGEMETKNMYVYGVDFGIGDIVQIKNEYGMSSRTRITEFIVNDSDTGHSAYPSFEVVNKEEVLVNEYN